IVGTEVGVLGVKVAVRPRGAEIKGTFVSNGGPAVLEHRLGRGRAVYFATTPAISYIKEAKFVRDALAEKWPADRRRALTQYAADAGAAPLAKLSEPVVE